MEFWLNQNAYSTRQGDLLSQAQVSCPMSNGSSGGRGGPSQEPGNEANVHVHVP